MIYLLYGWISAFTCFPSITSWKASFTFSSGNFPVIIDFSSTFLCILLCLFLVGLVLKILRGWVCMLVVYWGVRWGGEGRSFVNVMLQ